MDAGIDWVRVGQRPHRAGIGEIALHPLHARAGCTRPRLIEGAAIQRDDAHAALRSLAHDLVAHVAHRAGDKQRHVWPSTLSPYYAPNPNQRRGVSHSIFLRSAGSGTRPSNSLSSGP